MARPRSQRTEAIVLRRSDFGEADRLLTLYSRDLGKIRAIAKGARKPQSRKTGHVELFMRTQFMLATGRDLDIITQADLVEPYRELRTDLVRMTYASYFVELLDRFVPDEEENKSIYDLLASSFDWLADVDNVQLAARHYELRLLSLVGFQPQLFRCVVTGEPIVEENQYFSAELGGLISATAGRPDRNAKPISAVAVKIMRFLQTRHWETIQAIQLRPNLQRELEGLLHYYLTFYLERSLQSAEFLYRLRSEALALRDQQKDSNSDSQSTA